MSGNNVKKLCNYMYDCTRQAIKSASFNNLSDKDILIIDDDIFNGDDKKIIEIMTKYALNKSSMSLLYSDLFIKGDKLNTPLLYSNAELIREGDKIRLETEEEKTLNIGAVANLMSGEEEKIEAIAEQLLDVEACDLPTVMGGLLNMDGIEIINQRAIILAKLPDSTAGLLNELKQIAESEE